MINRLETRAFQERLERLEALLNEVDCNTEPAGQELTRAIVQALLDLHGAGLERLLEHVAEAGEAGRGILDACAGDEMVGGLLLLHGLHPLDLEARVREALETVRPLLRSHGGNVEFLAVHEGVVRLRLQGSCHGCPSSAVTLEQTVKEAIFAKAPEVTNVELEGLTESQPATHDNGKARVALPIL